MKVKESSWECVCQVLCVDDLPVVVMHTKMGKMGFGSEEEGNRNRGTEIGEGV
jgi:hypothetical protein